MAKKPVQTVWDKNFAEVPEIRARAEAIIPALQQRTRDNRRSLEDDFWSRFMNMWLVQKDQNHNYTGRANLYIPEVRKDVEAQTRDLVNLAFPNEDFFDCVPGPDGTKRGAKAWKALMAQHMDRARLKLKYFPYTRQRVLLGTSPAYVNWSEKTNRAFRNAIDPTTKKLKPSRKMLELYQGPDFTPRPLFQWFALNPRSWDFRDDGCFEDFTRTPDEVKALGKKGQCAGYQEILEGSKNTTAEQDEKLRKQVEQMEAQGILLRPEGSTSIVDLSSKGGPAETGSLVCTRQFSRMILPEAFDPDFDEDKESPIPVLIENFGTSVTLIRRNPFWHQQPPYVVGRYILPNIDELYGQGLPWAIQYMQLDMNSTYEQGMDSRTYAMNPIAFIDPALAQQLNDFDLEPAAKWFVPPNAVKFGALPDLSDSAYKSISFTRSLMQDYSDREPNLPAQLQGKVRTAAQAEMVKAATSGDIQLFTAIDEIETLQPLMQQWSSLIDQNGSEDQVVTILGRRATDLKRILVSKHLLLGSYDYFWKSTQFIANKPVVARQMIDLLKVYATIPPQAQAQVNLNFAEYFKSIWDLLGLIDGDKIVGAFKEEIQTTDPSVEHKMLDLGMEIEVSPGDDDDHHVTSHVATLEKIDPKKNPYEHGRLTIHIMQHQVQKQKKAQMMAEMQRQRQLQERMMIEQAQNGPRKSPGSGNRTQLSPNGSTSDMGSGVRA